MNLRRYSLLVFVMLFSLVLAACGGDSGTGGSAVALSQTFTADDSSVSFKYPEGWVVSSQFGQIMVANSQGAIDATEPTSGAFIALFSPLPLSAIPGAADSTNPAEVLDTFSESMQGEDAPELSAVTELKIGNFDAAMESASTNDTDFVIYAVKIGSDGYVIITGASFAGEIGQYEATLKAIIETITYTASG